MYSGRGPFKKQAFSHLSGTKRRWGIAPSAYSLQPTGKTKTAVQKASRHAVSDCDSSDTVAVDVPAACSAMQRSSKNAVTFFRRST